jgi:hypothetical protein
VADVEAVSKAKTVAGGISVITMVTSVNCVAVCIVVAMVTTVNGVTVSNTIGRYVGSRQVRCCTLVAEVRTVFEARTMVGDIRIITIVTTVKQCYNLCCGNVGM